MTGSDNSNLLAPIYGKYLKQEGFIVDYIKHPDEFEQAYHKSFFRKVYFRTLPYFFLKTINKNIIKKIESFKPDILWIFKGMEILPETLLFAKKRGIQLASYNPDHPFKFDTRGSGNKFVQEALTIYDIHFTYSKKIQRDLQKSFLIESIYLPFGYDLPEGLNSNITQEVNRICFIGHADARRKNIVESIISEGIQVDVYGPKWNSSKISSPLLSVKAPVYGVEYWETLKKYRIQLNIFRNHNEDSHNLRSFEIPAVGGIMLAPHTTEHLAFFESEKEFFPYKSDEEIIDRAATVISMKAEDVTEIRTAARERSIRSKYSYKERATIVSSTFKSFGA
jgi:spore maturation protein CgeB